jgi:sugar lactone lactonase YvrE
MTTFETVISDLTFPEGPRWHDGALWFSDMHSESVFRWVPGATAEVVAHVPGGPSGLGFLPDGRLLVVSMHDRSVLRVDPDGTHVHADLSEVASWHTNDMLVDAVGRAYVGNFGDGSGPPDPVTAANLAVVEPDGSVGIAATDLELPNGMVLVDDGKTLIVAETRAIPPRITTFAVAADGGLSDRRVLITLENEMPDGMTVDADDNIWFASPFTGELIHVSRDGTILNRVASPRPPYACVLGGPTGTTMYVCVANDWVPEVCRAERSGAILTFEVEVGARKA